MPLVGPAGGVRHLIANLREAPLHIRLRRGERGALLAGQALRLRERALRLRELASERVPLCVERTDLSRGGPVNLRARPSRLVEFAQRFLVLCETPLQHGLQCRKSFAFLGGFPLRLGERVFQCGLRFRELRVPLIRPAGRHLIADLREAPFHLRLRCGERGDLSAEGVFRLGKFESARIERGLLFRGREVRSSEGCLQLAEPAMQIVPLRRKCGVILRRDPLLLGKGVLRHGEAPLQFILLGGKYGLFFTRELQPL